MPSILKSRSSGWVMLKLRLELSNGSKFEKMFDDVDRKLLHEAEYSAPVRRICLSPTTDEKRESVTLVCPPSRALVDGVLVERVLNCELKFGRHELRTCEIAMS